MAQINNKTIASNTLILYGRMLFTLVISLYVTRRLLIVLGVSDFGLFNVVGGVVMMFSFLNNAMIAASQRFITYSLGTNNLSQQKKVFSTSVIIHVLIAILIILLLETIGLWYINNKLNVDVGRVNAVFFVFQASVISLLLSIINVPFSATVIAHEKMNFYAFASVLDSVLKLVIVLVLPYINYDKLISYSTLLILLGLVNVSIYIFYCTNHFDECKLIKIDKNIFSEMFSFAGWSFLGNFGVVAKDYGVNLIINAFCSTVVNASRGVAYQVMNAINGFVSGFQTAMNPQLTKRYAIGDTKSMLSLLYNGTKYSFLLLSLFVIPLYIRGDYVLYLWLGDVPEYSVQFLRLALIMALINSMSGPFVTSIQATGNIKLFQIIISIIMTLDMPLCFIFLKIGYPPYSVMYVSIMSAFVGLLVRAYLFYRQVKFDIKYFLKTIIIKHYIIVFMLFNIMNWISHFFENTLWGLVIFCLISVTVCTIIFFFVALNSNERNSVIQYVKRQRYA